MTGAPFSYTAVGGKKLAGNRYSVVAAGLSRAAAESSASKLSDAEPKRYISTYQLSLLYNAAGTKFAGWPPHFTCAGASYSLTRYTPPATSGFCWKGDTEPYSLKNTAILQWSATTNY